MADQRLLHHLRFELLHALLQAAGHAGEQGQLGGLRFSNRGAQHARAEQLGAEPGVSASASMRRISFCSSRTLPGQR